MLDITVLDQLKRGYEQLLEQAQLPSREKLQEYHATFLQRFGPEKLKLLEGETLLNTMHAHGNRDSLVYWLEFKNDDEFPDYFGSIAGGSALKFGIYRRKETSAWMIGQGDGQKEISIAEAIKVASTHRDQLVEAARFLEEFASDGPDEHYARLQERMDTVAPKVADTAWGHKYFSLIFPQKIDDFHVEEFQRFHLRKLLQLPPSRGGRYSAAGRYVSAAAELQIPLNHLTTTLNRIHGRPYKVWRIGTRLGGKTSIWSMMREGNCVAIGWPGVGDLSRIAEDQGKDRLRAKLEADGEIPTVAARSANQMGNFVTRISEGDLVLAADGAEILGIGEVSGAYQYEADDSDGAPHRRPVEWLDTRTWRLPEPEGLQSTVRQLNKHPVNLVEIEKRLFALKQAQAPGPAVAVFRAVPVLESVPGRLQSVLERKGQAIIYGPPGTGKTHWATLTVRQLAAHSAFGKAFEDLDPTRQAEVIGASGAPGLVRTCTFHPAYGYEDFIEGYRPANIAGQLSFNLCSGIFKRLCKDAEKTPHRNFYLLIDEINRGDIPRIFGELITLLEIDKRENALQLPVSGESFFVPKNVYIVGTMNTADRSIALLDTALRRRFGFIELMPDPEALGSAAIENRLPLGLWLSALNERVRKHVRRDARNLQIGHAYLMHSGRPISDFQRFVRVLAEDIFPLLEEYCYEDYSLLREVLGPALVDEDNQRIRVELFSPDRHDELLQALLAPSPEIATSAAAIAVQNDEPNADSDADDPAEENA